MQYELVSRALAYVSCFSALSLFMTSVAIAAINIGKVHPSLAIATEACIAGVVVADGGHVSGLTSPAQLDRLATRFWSTNI